MKLVIVVMVTIFSTLGAFVPYLWGDTDFFSGWSLLFGTVGGLFGIWVGVVVARRWL